MDLNEEEVGSLFADDRGTTVENANLSHWLSIHTQRDGVVIETEDAEYNLTESEVEAMKDELEWDSIWRAISEKHKCLRYVRRHNE